MLLVLNVSNADGLVKSESIDLGKKFQERNINNTTVKSTYSSIPVTQAGSIGVILPVQQINKTDYLSQQILSYTSEVSVNIRIRYDKNDSIYERWNIDVYVDLHGLDLSWSERQLIKKCPQSVHKFPDSEWIQVEWGIDGVKQQTYKLYRKDITK